MSNETYKQLIKIAYADYKTFEAKFEVLEAENPTLSYADVIDLIEHEAPELPEEFKDHDELYTAACLYVALNVPYNESGIQEYIQEV